MAYELSTLDLPRLAGKGARLVLKHPGTGAPLTDAAGNVAALIVAGRDSERYRDAERLITVELLEEEAARKARATPDFTVADLDAREVRNRRLLVAAVLGWEHGTIGGETACTPTTVTQLLREHRWIAEQVAIFVENRANFCPATPGAPRPASTTED